MNDIDDITAEARTIEILHPATKEPVGIRVTLVSIDDERLKRLKRKITDEKLRLEQRGKGFKAEDIENNQHELIVAAMTNWEWYDAKFRGEVPEFTPKNVKLICSEKEWFRNQVADAVGDVEAFFQKPKAI